MCRRDNDVSCEETMGDALSSIASERVDLSSQAKRKARTEQHGANTVYSSFSQSAPKGCRRLSPGMCFPGSMGHVVDKGGR